MDIYIAGRYSRRDEFRAVAETLRDHGHVVTSRWLDENEPLDAKMGDNTPEFYQETATIDLQDIKRSDIVLFFAEDPAIGIPRGGRLVEMGYALALDKTVEIIGSAENVFHLLPGLMHYPTFEVWLETKKAEVM